MTDTTAFKDLFPKEIIKAYDGMAVTADIWETAHDEHRSSLRAHMLTMHRPGILFGLEVKANDPADHYVFITPGVAIDSLGRMIIVDEAIAYDFGDEGEGTYMLLLGYSEREVDGSRINSKMIRKEYIIAARGALPKQPTIELARITLSQKGARIREAGNPVFPGKDELDLRFRPDDQKIEKIIRVGVFGMGQHDPDVETGWQVMNSEMSRMMNIRITADKLDKLTETAEAYDMVYIYNSGENNLSSEELAVLKRMHQAGKGILLDGFDTNGYECLKKFTVNYDCETVKTKYNKIMTQPFFFRDFPEWVNANKFVADGKLVLCADCLAVGWGGIRAGNNLSREEIRTNLEWGANVIRNCVG